MAHLSIQNRGSAPALLIRDGTALFTFAVYQPHVESVDQILDGSIAVAVNSMQALCGAEWNPSEVLLPGPRQRIRSRTGAIFGLWFGSPSCV